MTTTTTRPAALAATATALAAVDANEAADFTAAMDNEIAQIDEALQRAEISLAELREQIRTRERGIGTDEADRDKAAAALLAGEDVVAAFEPLEALTARKEAIAAGMRGLRVRRDTAWRVRDSGRARLRESLGMALAPLKDEMVSAAESAVAALGQVYADAVAAAACGRTGGFDGLERTFGHALAVLIDAGYGRGLTLKPSPDILEALKAGEAAMEQARCKVPAEVRRPTVPYDPAQFLQGAMAAGNRDSTAAS